MSATCRVKSAVGSLIVLLLVLSGGALLTAPSPSVAEDSCPGGQGPDVIVGDIHNAGSFPSVGGVSAFAIGTTSCNIGTEKLNWIWDTPVHPVIAQNLYRITSGRLEQIGMSWLKHGFAVAAGSLCGSCATPAFDALHVNCSDPYGWTLNADQDNLGPRSAVNASTGDFPVLGSLPNAPDEITRRLQVADVDVDPALNPGAEYLAEAQYVHPEDAAAGNALNNASSRPVRFSSTSDGLKLTLEDHTIRCKEAIRVWAARDARVRLFDVDIPGDGRVTVGLLTEATSAGTIRNEIAVHNLNSDRAVRSLTVETKDGPITAPGFHDVAYHSGEAYSADDWPSTVTGSKIVWETQTHAVNPDANALRWSTTYSFWMGSTLPIKRIVLGLFKAGAAGAPDTMEVLVPEIAPTPAPVTAKASAPGAWAVVPAIDVSVGRIDAQTAGRFRVSCLPGVTRELEAVVSSNPSFRVAPTREERDGRTEWTFRVEPTGSQKSRHFESIVTLTSKSKGDAPVRFRVFGTYKVP